VNSAVGRRYVQPVELMMKSALYRCLRLPPAAAWGFFCHFYIPPDGLCCTTLRMYG